MDAAVRGITDDRMPDGAEVHADLMGASGGNCDVEQRHAPQMFGLGHPRDRASGAARAGGHPLPMVGVAADCGVDSSPLLDQTPYQRDVFLLDFTIVELPRQVLMCAVVLGRDHHPGRSAVETMNYAWTEFAPDTAEIFDVIQECVDERAARMSRRRMHYHSWWFIDNDDVGVFIEDRKRQVLRFRGGR